MPLYNGKDISPDEAILLGLCPECASTVIPKTALKHARGHWNPERLDPSSEARRRYDLLAEFGRTKGGISKSVVQHPPVAASPSATDAQRHPILSRDNYYDLAALPFAFEAAAAFMHGDLARAILSSLIVIGIIYIVHNPENQFTTGFKKLMRSPLGAFGLLVFLLGYIAAPSILAKAGPILSSPIAEIAQPIPTQIRWQFVGGRQTPTVLYESNIAAWYTLWSPSVEMQGLDVKGNIVTRTSAGSYWTIFLTFKHPVTYQQLTLVSPNVSSYEVKQTNTGSAVIVVNQDIPAGVVEISTVP
jgi:hypothetical protein